jgi:hypothetical protein
MYGYLVFISTYNEGEKWRTEISEAVRLISQLDGLAPLTFRMLFPFYCCFFKKMQEPNRSIKWGRF